MSLLSPNDIAVELANTLPPTATRRDEIIAVGILATALISGVLDHEERAELVEFFCKTLRGNIAGELN